MGSFDWYTICLMHFMEKKKLITATALSLALLGSVFTTEAQSKKNMITPFRKGTTTFNLGVGVGSNYKNDYNSAFGTKAALEMGIWPAGPGVISLGVEAGLTTSNNSRRYYRDDFNARTFIAAGRTAWHYGWKVPGLDTYAGVSAGIGFYHYDYYYNNRYNYNDVFPAFGGFVGASYFFTPGFGVNAEAGFDITAIQGGLIFKIK